MKVWINRKEFEWFKKMQDEGRTRQIEISSYRRYKDESREVELELEEN
jgi:hypothetical protein